MIRRRSSPVDSDFVFNIGASLYAFLTENPVWTANCARLLDGVSSQATPLRVLDLGAGPANSAIAMGERRPGAYIVAFDIATRMVELAQRNRRRRKWPPDRLSLAQGDALHLPFLTDAFDVVTGHSFLYMFPDPLGILAETRRVSRSGGTVAFLEPADGPVDWNWLLRQRSIRLMLSMLLWRVYSRLHRRFAPADLLDLLHRAGFRHVHTEDTLGGFGLFGRGQAP